MYSPTAKLNGLSLDAMPPVTRSMSRLQGDTSPPPIVDYESSLESEESESDWSETDEDSLTIKSPTRIIYRLDNLTQGQRDVVRDTFNCPLQISLQRCRHVDNTYAFQMTELVNRSIRLHRDGERTILVCSCAGDVNETTACSHILWLLDQILDQTLYDHDRREPVRLNQRGFADEMGDLFERISKHHIDILAADLHCPLIREDADFRIDAARILEARELLASIHAEDPDTFRPDIFDSPSQGTKVIKRHDIDRTIFRMLLDNNNFFQYFRSLSRPGDPIRDVFRKLSQRVDRVLDKLDAGGTDGSKTTEWATHHIRGCVSSIRCAVFDRDQPLPFSEAHAAAAALVHILSAVVTRHPRASSHVSGQGRNLYMSLVGERDIDFVVGVLSLLPEAACHFLYDLEALLEQVETYGAPVSYVTKFRTLIASLRGLRPESRPKRANDVTASGRRSKRMK
ncbi:uncharacterized protein F5Z01DRAFT_301777 [Emericellopsis atlantica]|uniref:SWIM-type domain-containing protein n=1 Tax=Emericellopsis atlantica TaxID=2614577 RepID=A0A9P7ZU47_9HYPO|nr:uncharacterized protein F5Z01DRAFT_301777 [Emericellopsis atlantica]KAG9257807.1 hypothetical protein F5Z01DRAFT_301777 [Emericellopsis atlantica]